MPPAHVAIIGYGYWQRRFGGQADAIGRRLSIGTDAPYTIIGVAPKGLRVEHDVDLWTPLPLDFDRGRRSDFLQVIGRLRPGATVAGAQQELATLARHLQERFPDTNSGWDVFVVSLQEQMVGEVRPALLAFMGAVGLVLLHRVRQRRQSDARAACLAPA